MDISVLIDGLHPLEVKVLTVFGTSPAGISLATEQLATGTTLEPSQLSMAIEWLLAKQLLSINSETITPVVSLTSIGETYFEQSLPIERVFSAARAASSTGKRLTIPDLHAKEGLDPSDVSKAVGRLKKEGVLLIVQGGCIESTGRPSPSVESMRALLQQLHEAPRELESFSESHRQLIQDHAVKRGNAKEPFRIDDRVARSYVLSPTGVTAADHLAKQGVAEEVSQLSPELLKDGSWRAKRFRKYTISLRAPRIGTGKKHPYREFLDTVKTKLVSMGFQEMRGSLVETEFWNMDALFMPQFHPARDIHDVYFVKEPKHAAHIAEPFLSRVTKAHENGGATGSTGWGYTFDSRRAKLFPSRRDCAGRRHQF
ncbi:MAG: hypothetical protein HY038_05020 [Nitrospirae bacterium]|nr:hypothetical protein [Nitrospirota bacterium]